MKRVFILLVSLVALFSCGKEVREIKGLNGLILEQYEVSETSNGSILKNGFYKAWFPNGQIRIDGNYDQNKLNGHYKEYYKGGQIKNEGEYINGKKEGKWILNHSNGKVQDIVHYKDGLADGEFQSFYESGKKRAEGKYLNDKEEGKFSYWNEDGKLSRTKNYRAGVDVSLEGKWLIDGKYTITYNEDGTYALETDKGIESGKYKLVRNIIYLGSNTFKLHTITDSTYTVTPPVYFDQTLIYAKRLK